METENEIEKVAIYLRKSRGDEEEDVLSKHRQRLLEFAEQKGWSYEIFQEKIGTGDGVEHRPELKRLLDFVEDGLYDGVLVVEYERLSRAGTKDLDEIIKVFHYNDTYLITPEKIYDPNNTGDLTLLGILSVLSNAELRTIVKRLVDGKKDGAIKGNWTNGKPPYPYEYITEVGVDKRGRNKIIGHITVNEEKKTVYTRIKKMYLSGKFGTEEISFILNREGISSPNGSTWHNNTVKRLLVHPFHMGQVIYGKNQWKKRRDNKRKITRHKNESEWSVGEGQHPRLKTPEEHEKILELLAKNRKVPHKSKAGCFPTTGLLYCRKCGYRMVYSVGRIEVKSGKSYNYTKCAHHSPVGTKCPQTGVKMDEDFYGALFQAIVSDYLDKGHLIKLQQNCNFNMELERNIKQKRDTLIKAEKALIRIKDAYEAEIYTLAEFSERKKAQETLIESLKAEIQELKNTPQREFNLPPEELENRICEFKSLWEKGASPKEINTLMKSIVKKIFYDRTDNEVTFEIEYL
ncbi:site-specific recombinase, DNA invertase Pin [Desulfosporosinus acidiphilus SJ4]|uniref:Site-specific recombinase, DNA invertase Pin n=1 Tax=Desulfosporosinus acidiphilus (strain DSM 22704 / JCM 16185 / SJ4) TaxID=646529 RepID=I4D5G9_DESAJ|nr:recombinase family protein [Desulfosporosinus acidiphilus]AFM41043.1 site-specific recombinase, DNA invertase Pin [Desulfosporosinus acidiphilus SJ4]